MVWYVTFADETGALTYEGEAAPPPPGDGFVNMAIDPPPVAGQEWDPAARAYTAAPDPIYGGEDVWYAYVDPAGAIASAGRSPQAPAGLQAVQLQPFPTGAEDWNPAERAFLIEPGIRALLLRQTIPTILGRLSTVEATLARLPDVGLPAESTGPIQADLEARRDALVGDLRLALGTYVQAQAAP